MAVTVEQVKRVLVEIGIKVAHVEARLVFNVAVGEEPLLVAAEIDDDVLQFRTVNMLLAPGPGYRKVLLRALLDSCFAYKMIKLAFDPADGEVVGYVDLYLGDAQLTRKQIERCLAALLLMHIVRSRCEAIVATGKDPGGDQLPKQPPGALAAHRAAGSPMAKNVKQPKKPPRAGSGFDDLLEDILNNKSGKG
jgi:hypothetical protein